MKKKLKEIDDMFIHYGYRGVKWRLFVDVEKVLKVGRFETKLTYKLEVRRDGFEKIEITDKWKKLIKILDRKLKQKTINDIIEE